MKRRNTVRGGEGGEQGGNNRNHNKKKKKQPPAPPVIGTVATRTRHHKKAKAAKCQHPVSILINIFGYADPELLRLLCGVSKQFRDIIYHNPGMENKIVPLLWIRPSEEEPNDKGRLQRLLQQLYVHRDKLQRHREVKIIAGHKFLFTIGYNNWRKKFDKTVVAKKLHFEGVVSLDMSSPIATQAPLYDLIAVLAIILPNLRKINLSNTKVNFYLTFDCFMKQRFHLESITWNNIAYQSEVKLDGYELKDCKNLKEICMDNSVFYDYHTYHGRFSDLVNDENSDHFLFQYCSSTVLERVSIKNARYGGNNNTTTILPQNTLIKFVRKSPTSLRWFRSDLSSENMTMLRSERPEIELVN